MCHPPPPSLPYLFSVLGSLVCHVSLCVLSTFLTCTLSSFLVCIWTRCRVRIKMKSGGPATESKHGSGSLHKHYTNPILYTGTGVVGSLTSRRYVHTAYRYRGGGFTHQQALHSYCIPVQGWWFRSPAGATYLLHTGTGVVGSLASRRYVHTAYRYSFYCKICRQKLKPAWQIRIRRIWIIWPVPDPALHASKSIRKVRSGLDTGIKLLGSATLFNLSCTKSNYAHWTPYCRYLLNVAALHT